MPSTPPPPGPVRPSDVVNEEIRTLIVRAGGWLYGPSRDRYEVLVAEWTVAVAAERGDIVKAA
jgi:hypothetical protein